MSLSNEDVGDILRLLDSSPYDELHLQTHRFALTLRRGRDGGWTQETQSFGQPHLVGTGSEVAAATPAGGNARATAPAQPREGLHEVTSPLIGTFYRAPKPGAPPFVEVGSPVEPETVVGIIESMKMMISVHAGVQGTIAEICLDDAQFAEQGAVLLRIDAGAP